jgi:ATP synthase protein I
MTAEPPSPSLKDLEARLGRLRERAGLEKEGKEERGGNQPKAQGSAMGAGLRAGVELLAGVGVGGALGWFLDGWLGTRPFLMLLFFALGAAAGMLNVYRMARAMNAPDEKTD